MAKLAAIVLLLVALAASASAYTTVVTTTVTEEANPRRGESCSTEMQERMPMKHCMMWMQKKMRGPYSFDDAFLRSAVANPRFKEEHLQQCCSEIKQFSTGCQCDAVKEMMTEMPQHGMEEVEEMVRSLPRMCGISGCHI